MKAAATVLETPGMARTQPLLRASATIDTILSAIAVAGMLLVVTAPLIFVPAEDATILYQYSDHLAMTGRIAYNTGGPRVEGATDFLWMVLLAGFRKLHIPAFWATAGMNA